MSAPERIYREPHTGAAYANPDPEGDDQVYIRADLHDAAIAAARAEGWNAAIKAAADEVEEHKHFAKGIECCAECIRKMARPEAQP